MKKHYILMLNHGDYDDHVSFPIASCQDYTTAELIKESLESQEGEYYESLIPEDFQKFFPYVDIIEVPYIKL